MPNDIAVAGILAQLPEDAPPELREAIVAHLGQMDLGTLVAMLGDAMRARALLDEGDQAGAQAILQPYREMAAAAGLTDVFDAMLGGAAPQISAPPTSIADT